MSGRPGLEASEAPRKSHYHKKGTKGAQEDGGGRTGMVLSGRSCWRQQCPVTHHRQAVCEGWAVLSLLPRVAPGLCQQRRRVQRLRSCPVPCPGGADSTVPAALQRAKPEKLNQIQRWHRTPFTETKPGPAQLCQTHFSLSFLCLSLFPAEVGALSLPLALAVFSPPSLLLLESVKSHCKAGRNSEISRGDVAALQ